MGYGLTELNVDCLFFRILASNAMGAGQIIVLLWSEFQPYFPISQPFCSTRKMYALWYFCNNVPGLGFIDLDNAEKHSVVIGAIRNPAEGTKPFKLGTRSNLASRENRSDHANVATVPASGEKVIG